MRLIDSPILKWYFHLFQFVAKTRIKENDIDLRDVHTTLVMVLSTGLFMWAYALLAYFTISSPVPGLVGIICATVHLLSPLLYRYFNRSYCVSNIGLFAGVIHQGTFTYYTGGFMSHVLIWYGIIPVLGGVISGKKGATTWLIITLFISTIFFILHMTGYQFPNLISKDGELWTHALLVFGWIILSSTIVIVYAGLRENTERILQQQGKKIDDLFRVLFHDLANPLGRISIGLTIAERTLPESQTNRGLEIAKTASESMLEITQNIRKMYAVSKGKANVDLSMTTLNSTMDYIKRVYSPELDKKNIQLHYDYNKNKDVRLLVEPVSFNNQVIGNIVSNAIKFSPANGEIHINTYSAENETVIVEIKDNGIGIPKSLVAQLFDISKKTTRPGTDGEPGTGFGMHIMKSFVEMYGGQVQIDSVESINGAPSGTTVKLILKGKCK